MRGRCRPTVALLLTISIILLQRSISDVAKPMTKPGGKPGAKPGKGACELKAIDMSDETHADIDRLDAHPDLGSSLRSGKFAAAAKFGKGALNDYSLGWLAQSIAPCLLEPKGFTVSATLVFRKDGSPSEQYLHRLFPDAVFKFSASMFVSGAKRKFKLCMPLTPNKKISDTQWELMNTRFCYTQVAKGLDGASKPTLTLKGGLQYNQRDGDPLMLQCAFSLKPDSSSVSVGLYLIGLYARLCLMTKHVMWCAAQVGEPIWHQRPNHWEPDGPCHFFNRAATASVAS